MGREVRRSVGRFRARRYREDQGRAGPRGLQNLGRPACGMEKVSRAAQTEVGERREESRRRSRQDLERNAGVACAVQGGLLTGRTTRTAANLSPPSLMKQCRCWNPTLLPQD